MLKKGIMEAREIMDLSELKEGKFGILEPIKNSIKINFEEIDLSIIPCISANKEGYRLGYGGGYYDRFFENKSIKNSFILCREKMIYDNIPFEKHDIKFEHVLTDKNWNEILCLICYYLIEIFNISGQIIAKALILIDYCNDFIADNGKLTIGKRVQEIEGSISDLAKEA